jgi:hypothetical protein
LGRRFGAQRPSNLEGLRVIAAENIRVFTGYRSPLTQASEPARRGTARP